MKVENKEIFANNLSFYMKQKGVDRNTLCADLDLKYTTVRDWLKGITYPRIGKIELLANYFNINKSDLIENKISTAQPSDSLLEEITNTARKLNTDNKKIVLRTSEELLESQKNEEETKINEVSEVIQLYSYDYYDHAASAGTGQYLNDVRVEQIELPVDIDADFVIPIKGDSMEPDYHDGDLVFIQTSVELNDGVIGVFNYNGEAYIKQLVIDKDQAYLHSLNPAYKDMPITPDTDFRIIGEVVDIYQEG
ncbi:S24 family peptidase [Streptococcus oralis]|jgi:putative phage repressor|uniref:S24 family peptidase n=1 Tax=Streptococcus oralis TaxID=1303 RepID=UPI002556ECD4|nr:S24 family peptidase [Streptococcus oralis]MDK7308210.1 S24 family peptidase [Streptococcus oralis]MDK7311482.1 S24 family peptidase [Streptococcus oralis]MDK7311540.1 S24 family peptidase [Streptococcus oralis]